MGNYVTTSEVTSFKVDGRTIDLSSYTSAEISDEINLAESFIETLTGDIFYARNEVNKFDGNGLSRLFFFPRISYRLSSINYVKEYDINGTNLLRTYIENKDFVKHDYYLEMDWGEVWPKGKNNIWISGVWGRVTTPPEIKRAVILLVLERLIPGSVGLSVTGDVMARWDDFEIRKFPEKIHGQSSGYIEVDRLLEPHINYSTMFLVVPDDKQLFDGGQIKIVH